MHHHQQQLNLYAVRTNVGVLVGAGEGLLVGLDVGRDETKLGLYDGVDVGALCFT